MEHKITCLVYCFNSDDKVLLMKRNNPPNLGQWSPVGGKVHTSEGESPHACAQRETQEELSLDLPLDAFHLCGVISEKAYEGEINYYMFIFVIKDPVDKVPESNDEGELRFFNIEEVDKLDIPQADRDILWPIIKKDRKGFFSLYIDCTDHPELKHRIDQQSPVS